MKTRILDSHLPRGRSALFYITGLTLIMAVRLFAEPSFSVLHSFGIWTNMTGFWPRAKLVQGADGTLYGTAPSGEGPVRGTVFKLRPDGSGFAVLKYFTNLAEGFDSYAGLALSGNTLYGTTYSGGAVIAVTCYTNRFGQVICSTNTAGVVFKVNTDGTGYTVLKQFTGGDGLYPYAGLTVSGNTLYGTTTGGGSSGNGTVFKVNTDGSGFTVIKNFTGGSDGAIPYAGVILSGNTLYGTTRGGGSSGNGTVFKVNTDGGGYMMLKSFTGGSDGGGPDSSLVLSGSTLYGGAGWVLFKMDMSGSGFTVIHTFDNVTDGSGPNELVLNNGTLYGTARWGGDLINGWNFGTVFKLQTDGSGFTVLHRFTRRDTHPLAGLVLDGDTLYGTATYDGVYGSVFAINTNGSGYTVLKKFAYSDGVNPLPNLVLNNGVLYGTANRGGSSDFGTVFKVNTDGSGYTTLKNQAEGEGNPTTGLVSDGATLYGGTLALFGPVLRMNTDGSGYASLTNFPFSGGPFELVVAADTIYGTTRAPGVPSDGILFKINTNGSGFTILKTSSIQQEADGREFRGLLLKGSTLYGTATYGGDDSGWGYGTVFAINTDGGGFTVLKHFTGSDGANPRSGLVSNGSTLYGATQSGGTFDRGTVFKINTDGSDYTVLKHFDSTQPGEGLSPVGTLVLRGDTLYGTAADGGTGNLGTIFKLQTDGSGYAVLHRFTGRDGRDPLGNLLWSNGALYGTTASGGELGFGTVFALSVISPIALNLERSPDSSGVVLSWNDPAFALQSAPAITGPFITIQGATSPHTNSTTESRQFFRLISN